MAWWPFTSVTQPNLDPDLGAVPTVVTALTAAAVGVGGAVFTNASGVARTVTLTDTAGVALLNAVDIPSDGIAVRFDWAAIRLVGLKWVASGAGVNGKVFGWT